MQENPKEEETARFGTKNRISLANNRKLVISVPGRKGNRTLDAVTGLLSNQL